MREFEIIKAPNAPMRMPVVVKVADKNNLAQYESWCYTRLGKKACDNSPTPVWYQARGFFFFSNAAIAAKFMLGATVGQTIGNNTEHGISELKNRLYSAFPSASS